MWANLGRKFHKKGAITDKAFPFVPANQASLTDGMPPSQPPGGEIWKVRKKVVFYVATSQSIQGFVGECQYFELGRERSQKSVPLVENGCECDALKCTGPCAVHAFHSYNIWRSA